MTHSFFTRKNTFPKQIHQFKQINMLNSTFHNQNITHQSLKHNENMNPS
jgi:hypothetical protein